VVSALGTDQVAAEILRSRKLKWIAVIPSAEKHKLGKRSQLLPLPKVAGEGNKKVTLCSHYSRGVLQARDLWMVN
jgi:hypothetical protein